MPRSWCRAFTWPVVVVALVLVASLTRTAELSPTQVATQPLRPNPLPVGTFTEGGPQEGRCPESSDECTNFTVSDCTNVAEPQDGVIAYSPAVGTPRGMVVFFSGGGGTYFWTENSLEAETLVNDLREEGLAVVQVRWNQAWTVAGPDEQDAGAAHVACRPATAVDWIHDNLYTELDVDDQGVGKCGFCVTGTSGGATQAAYPLSHYGMEEILDAVVPVSGPTHAAMAKGCLRREGEDRYWYSGPSTRNIDYTFGYTGDDGPCRSNSTDPYWEQRWDEESVATQGSDYTHPQTRVHFVIGGTDRAMQAHSSDYYDRLAGQGSPLLVMEVVPGMPHSVTHSTEGLEAMKAALVGNSPPPMPALTINDGSVTEGDAGPTTTTFTVSLSPPSQGIVTVNYATADQTATAGEDYVANSGTLSFAANETTKTIAVVVEGDTIAEPNESFAVNLSNASNATVVKAQGVATILDDDEGAAAVTDFDGDGATDIAVFRPSSGRWYINGTAGSTAFGVNGDVPVPGDFDGDGDTDIAVFRPSSGRWYINGTAGSTAFGVNGDVPLPLPGAVYDHYYP